MEGKGEPAELVRICDPDGRPRGSGFVADDRGTVVTSHEAVDGLDRLLLHGPGQRTWTAGRDAVTPLAPAGLALVRTDGLGARPLPVAAAEQVPPGAYVRLAARGWRQARVLGEAEVTYTAGGRSHVLGAALDLALGTDGMDALRLGGEACGTPLLDARTGAVLAVVGTALHARHRSGGFAVPLRAAARAEPGGPLAALLDRNAVTVPCYGTELNLAGALQLTGTTLGTALADAAGAVDRPDVIGALSAFTVSPAQVFALVGDPGTGRTTELAALAARRALGPRPSPTLWLRGADLRPTDTSLADALTRALTSATRITTAEPPPPGSGDPRAEPESGSGPGSGPEPGHEPRAQAGSGSGPCCGPGCRPGAEAAAGPGDGPGVGCGCGDRGVGPGFGGAYGEGSAGGPGPDADHRPGRVAALALAAGRPLVVLLDAPEEMPPQLAQRLADWTAASVRWLREHTVRMVVATRPEYWERAGALYPPDSLHTPARPAHGLPPALHLADLTPAEAEEARVRHGIPADSVRRPDDRHPLTLRLLSGIRAAGVTEGRPGRQEVFAAHLDLLCLRVAVRIAAGHATPGRVVADVRRGAAVHGPGVRRLATRVAGRVHEAARRCLGPGQGRLDRESFEELFPWRTGWAPAVLTEGLLELTGTGYRLAHEEFADWLQAVHLDLPAALDALVHRTGPPPGTPVPRHRIGPVLEALLLLPPAALAGTLTGLVAALDRFAGEGPPAALPEAPPEAAAGDATDPDRVWWARRLLRGALLRAPDARPLLDVLHGLAEHVVRAGPDGFGGRFWNRLRLPEADRLDLLRRVLPADPAGPADPGATHGPGSDRCLDAAARRLVRDPRLVQPLLCAWFADERPLHGRPGATVATAAQALLHTQRRLAPDDLTEALVRAAHPRADQLLAVLAEEEPAAVCRAVFRWARDDRPGRAVAAAAYGQAAAPHVTDAADRALLGRAALALLERPGATALHAAALAVLLRDPAERDRRLPAALACPDVPAAALVDAAEALPDRAGAVFDALGSRPAAEVLPALAALTGPGPAARAAGFVREHLARHPADARHAAGYLHRRLDRGPAAAPGLRLLIAELLAGPAEVRAAVAGVLGAAGAEASRPLRAELLDVLLAREGDPAVLDALLGAVAGSAATRGEDRTRELLRRTGRRLLSVPGGAAVFDRRVVELARALPAFARLLGHWLREEPREAAALLGPSARRSALAVAGDAGGAARAGPHRPT
ncbi:serine protease [Streptomyces sp. NPDC012888]|uniref:serine protease n=1 Tax=Streptomyces sp. NPDC012888 TaxID=3364855 RepID=UPI0036B11ACB